MFSLLSTQGTGRLPTSESSPATGYLSCVQKPEAVVHAMKVLTLRRNPLRISILELSSQF